VRRLFNHSAQMQSVVKALKDTVTIHSCQISQPSFAMNRYISLPIKILTLTKRICTRELPRLLILTPFSLIIAVVKANLPCYR